MRMVTHEWILEMSLTTPVLNTTLAYKRHQNDAKNTCIHDATTVTTWERPTGSGQVGVHHSTVVRLEQRYNTTGTSADRPRAGRPRVTTAAQDRTNRLSQITGLKCQGHMWDSNTYIWFHKIRAKTLKKISGAFLFSLSVYAQIQRVSYLHILLYEGKAFVFLSYCNVLLNELVLYSIKVYTYM